MEPELLATYAAIISTRARERGELSCYIVRDTMRYYWMVGAGYIKGETEEDAEENVG